MPSIPQRVKLPARLIAHSDGLCGLLVQRLTFATWDDQRGRFGRGDIAAHKRQARTQPACRLHFKALLIALPHIREDVVNFVFIDTEIDEHLSPEDERKLQNFARLVVDTGTDQPQRMSAVAGTYVQLGVRQHRFRQLDNLVGGFLLVDTDQDCLSPLWA